MDDEAVKFFNEQFHEDKVPTDFRIIDHIPTLIGEEKNKELLQQPTKEEVKRAVFGLNGESANGLDGFSVASFILAGLS